MSAYQWPSTFSDQDLLSMEPTELWTPIRKHIISRESYWQSEQTTWMGQWSHRRQLHGCELELEEVEDSEMMPGKEGKMRMWDISKEEREACKREGLPLRRTRMWPSFAGFATYFWVLTCTLGLNTSTWLFFSLEGDFGERLNKQSWRYLEAWGRNSKKYSPKHIKTTIITEHKIWS